MRYTLKNNMLFFPEACMANMYTHGMVCWKMIKLGLVKNYQYKPPYPSRNDIISLAEDLGLKLEDVTIKDYKVLLWTSMRDSRYTLLSEIIHSRYKICVKTRYI